MFAVGQRIAVLGKSQKGKNRVREWGNVWSVRQVLSNRIQIVSVIDYNQQIGCPLSTRWVDLPNDSDLEILAE